jgi:transcription antitermination factor NusG
MAPSDSLDSPQLTFPAAISEPNDGISEPNDGISEPNYAIAEPDSEESFSAESAIGLPVTNEQDENARKWWAVYTKPRFEKKLMRQLFESQVPFYGPMISRRFRSPNGKLRLSIEPLFPNYVFIHGTEMQRYTAICTGSVSRWMPVANPYELVTDLRQIHNLILTDAPLAPELRLQPGQKVRVRSGVFKGFEGVILRRENQVRLLIAVRYMGRGASVALDDCQLEPI